MSIPRDCSCLSPRARRVRRCAPGSASSPSLTRLLLCLGEGDRFSLHGEKNRTAFSAANTHTGYPSGTPFIDYWWSLVPSRATSLLEVLVEPLQVMAPPMYSLSAILRLPSSSSRTRDGNVGSGSTCVSLWTAIFHIQLQSKVHTHFLVSLLQTTIHLDQLAALSSL